MSEHRKSLRNTRRLFDRGRVDEAARLLFAQRAEALQANDQKQLNKIKDLAREMRERLEGDPRLPGFDALLRGEEVEYVVAYRAPVEISPVSLGIALAGAALMLLAVFLPQFESTSFAHIEKNTLIQNGDGWWFIILSVAIAGEAYRGYRGRRKTWGPTVSGVIGIAIAVYDGTSHSQRRLCSVGVDYLGRQCSLATPGIGIYAAGIGGLLAVIGGWQMFTAKPMGDSPSATSDGRERPPSVQNTDPGIAERLRTLDQLLADGLITDAEHSQRRAALLEQI